MTIMLRSTSEPPEGAAINQKTGLRCGFPIRINGSALGSQENLSHCSSGNSSDIFGPRIGSSRQGSTTPDSVQQEHLARTRGLRGTTPVKLSGVQLLRSPSPPRAEPDLFAMPFGPVQGRQWPHSSHFGQRRGVAAPPPPPPSQIGGTELRQRSLSQSNVTNNFDFQLVASIPSTVKQTSNAVLDMVTTQERLSQKIEKLSDDNSQLCSGESNITAESDNNYSNIFNNDKTNGIFPNHSELLFSNNSMTSCSVDQHEGNTTSEKSNEINSESTKETHSVSESSCNVIQQKGFTKSESFSSQQSSEVEMKTNYYSLDHFPPVASQPTSEPFKLYRPNHYKKNITTKSDTTFFSSCSVDNKHTDFSTNKLEHAIVNMAETLETFKSEISDESKVENVEHALNSMKQTLNCLRAKEDVIGVPNLEDVVSSMKDTLKSLKTQVNLKTLRELNREMTPFDLPALSPVPHGLEVKKNITKFDVQAQMDNDIAEVELVDTKSYELSNSSTQEEWQTFKEVQQEKYEENLFEVDSVTNDCKDYTQSDMKHEMLQNNSICTHNQQSQEEINQNETFVKEYNIEAKIKILPTVHSFHENIDDTKEYSNEKLVAAEDISMTSEIESLGLMRCTKAGTKIESGIINQEVTDCANKYEENQSESVGTPLDKREQIGEHHSAIINACLSELENSQIFGSETKKKESSLNFNTNTFKCEDNIDMEDLEHLHVEKFKAEVSSYQNVNESIRSLRSFNSHDQVADSITSFDSSTTVCAPTKEDLTTPNDPEPLTETVDESELESQTQTETETDLETDSDKVLKHSTTTQQQNSFFMTEFTTSETDTTSSYSTHFTFPVNNAALVEKRKRNKTIDLHDLPSLFWAGTVKDYHERQYANTQTNHDGGEEQSSGTENPIDTCSAELDKETGLELVKDDRVELAKDGLGLILESDRLQNIELKLDELKTIETNILTHDTRRHSLPGRISGMSFGADATLSNTTCTTVFHIRSEFQENINVDKEIEETLSHADDGIEEKGDAEDADGASNISTPTFQPLSNKPQELDYESDMTMQHDSDCDVLVDEKSDSEHETNLARWTYKPLGLNISELSDCSELESEDEDKEARQRRIESLAAAIASKQSMEQTAAATPVQRAQLNMEIDTLSERSEEEGEKEERERRPQRGRRLSGRKRSMSRERSVAKLRYCWRCHHAGHENWQCQEDVQPGGWCPRCLEPTHWEDTCWVEQAHVLCPICSIPGHLPCVHQATDFRQRKLVIDTFGWLAFKEWFQDMTFRSWWNCSGYTGVPLYKIMQRNPSQDLDLGFNGEK